MADVERCVLCGEPIPEGGQVCLMCKKGRRRGNAGSSRKSNKRNRLNARVTEVILSALREQAERKKGCVWCKENGMVTHNGQHYELFCSYCGRRLEVEGKVNE